MKKRLLGILMSIVLTVGMLQLFSLSASAGGYDAWTELQKVLAGDTEVTCPAFDVSSNGYAVTVTLNADIISSNSGS